MGKDRRGVLRGKCRSCECDEFENLSGDILCEHCGHRPLKHEGLIDQNPNQNQSQTSTCAEQELVQKKPRQDEPVSINEIVSLKDQEKEAEVTIEPEPESPKDQQVHGPLQQQTTESSGSEVVEISAMLKALQSQADELASDCVKYAIHLNGTGKLKTNWCKVCLIDVSLEKVNQGMNMLKQHIAIPKHKTNCAISTV